MLPEAEQLLRAASQMMDSGAPLSFYDAMTLVRRARRLNDVDDRVLGAMITLHDLPRTTDGARDIFGEFLRTFAQRQAAERELAARAILLKDSGKTARLTAGGSLHLELEEKRGAGYRWQVEQVSRGLRCERRGNAPGEPPRASFSVPARRVGLFRLTMVEEPPPNADPDPERRLRRFELRVAVERSG